MPSKLALVDNVVSQMMKGGRLGRLMATSKQKENFKLRHKKHIIWAINNLPRSSAAVPAVVVKCLIKYDEDRVGEFCKALQYNMFQGQNDPAFLLWKFLQKPGHDTIAVYQRTVCAAKAYMEHKQLQYIRPLKEDIFAWDEGWTVPDNLLKNWNPDSLPKLQLIQ